LPLRHRPIIDRLEQGRVREVGLLQCGGTAEKEVQIAVGVDVTGGCIAEPDSSGQVVLENAMDDALKGSLQSEVPVESGNQATGTSADWLDGSGQKQVEIAVCVEVRPGNGATDGRIVYPLEIDVEERLAIRRSQQKYGQGYYQNRRPKP